MKSFFEHNIFSIFWLVMTLVVLLLPFRSLPTFSYHYLLPFDKIVHFILFFGCQLFLTVGMKKQSSFIKFRLKAPLYIFAIMLLISAFTEMLQAYLPIYRNSDWYDLLFNVLGLLSGWIAFRLIYGKQCYYNA